MGSDLSIKHVSAALVRSLDGRAPRIGSSTRIACGVRSTNGRAHHTVVAGPDDRYRRCVVLGYQVDVTRQGVELLVRVLLNQRHPLIEREHVAHINCLESHRGN